MGAVEGSERDVSRQGGGTSGMLNVADTRNRGRGCDGDEKE